MGSELRTSRVFGVWGGDNFGVLSSGLFAHGQGGDLRWGSWGGWGRGEGRGGGGGGRVTVDTELKISLLKT